ncbi:ribosome maturation factor RimP [Planomonospora parontospora subsp. parontospora]|uniref:Ribosome maturation factor RimP n=2 Tax=Planomonospora parontospora TaxID=58119 RepID=A0AA37F550_9ACTN|nr:ribosome maturation factor RimP [Planomonospora parontospora]GGK72970.1 ribosome maturation factor RimP [Planomonospora parontospora]GII09341.1 ribosome maturation factor RimP [Planomonospora parontospora subsp. parontospora]
MGSVTSRDRLMKLLGPVVEAEGFDLEDVTVTPAGKRRLLRVVVDRDGGVSLDGVAEVSHVVSAALDAGDAMGSAPYVLEVSSPGVDRPLTEPRHWRRAAGRLVKADLRDGTCVEGRIVATDETGVELDVEGVRHRADYQDLARGRVQVEFRRLDESDDAEDDGEDGDEG